MVKAVQLSIELELQKHPEVSSCMELAMEHTINQMNQLSLHLLQPKVSKNRDMERELSTIQCYKCQEMGHYSKECPNLLALPTRENVGSSTQRFYVEEKGKTQIHLIELMNEG